MDPICKTVWKEAQNANKLLTKSETVIKSDHLNTVLEGKQC
jgi:hypothetical protein